MDRSDDLDRIRRALDAAGGVLRAYTPGSIDVKRKPGGDPVTEADLEVDRAVKEILETGSDGWLSEETRDDRTRLRRDRVWIVDPLDGTREFVSGIPEWCVSIGLVEKGAAVAGGILNPVTGECIVGSTSTGVELNGRSVRATGRTDLDGARILASRTEIARGEWDRFKGTPIRIVPMGSVAYKMALVAAGLADATWTLVPKNEWDVAAGIALVRAAGGEVRTLSWEIPRLNRRTLRLEGLVACGSRLAPGIQELLNLGSPEPIPLPAP